MRRGHAIREGRGVVARTEGELETLGRKALAEKARLKAAARNSLDEVRRGAEAGRDCVDRVAGDVRRGVHEGVKVVVRGAQGEGKATARLLGDAAGQVTASQPMEREIVHAMGPAARDLAGKARNAPNTLVGLAYGGAGHAAGLALGTEPYVTVGANAIQFRDNPFGGAGAITLGNTTPTTAILPTRKASGDRTTRSTSPRSGSMNASTRSRASNSDRSICRRTWRVARSP